MGGPSAARALIEAAQQALRTLAAAPLLARAARAAAQELDAEWRRAPLVLGVGGLDVAGRTALLDLVGGGGVLDGRERSPGSAAVRVRRGPVTRYRAVRVHGDDEVLVLPQTGVDLEARARVEDARVALALREREAARAEAALPAVIRERPRWWAVWRWPWRWVATLRARRDLAAQRQAAVAIEEARRELAQAERDLAAREAPLGAARRNFLERLNELSSGTGPGAGVRELDIDVAGDAVPDGVEALELNGWSHAAAAVDAVVIVAHGAVQAPGGRGGTTRTVGAPAEVVARLPALLADARALRLARRVHDQVAAGLQELEDVLARAARDFATRIARIEELRVTDPAAFVAEQRARLSPQISASVAAVMEHASAHLGAELAGLTGPWIRAVAAAGSVDELKAAVARVDDGAAELARIAEEVRLLVAGGLGGCARDLYGDMVAALLPHGMPEEHARTPRRAVEVPAVTILPSLTRASSPRLGESEGWLTGLVRSLDSRRADLRQKVEQHVERLGRLASAEMLDAEPRLHAALGDALAAQLGTALGHQVAWLEGALAAERETIARERTALTPVVQQRADVRRELERLAAVLARVEAAQPAMAQASAATPAVGSAAT